MVSREVNERKANPNQDHAVNKDSFNISAKRSPLMWFALLQVPIVIGMVLGLYLMYKSSQN